MSNFAPAEKDQDRDSIVLNVIRAHEGMVRRKDVEKETKFDSKKVDRSLKFLMKRGELSRVEIPHGVLYCFPGLEPEARRTGGINLLCKVAGASLDTFFIDHPEFPTHLKEQIKPSAYHDFSDGSGRCKYCKIPYESLVISGEVFETVAWTLRMQASL